MSELRKYERLQLIRGGLLRGLVGLVGFGLLLVGTGCISIDLLSGGGSEVPLVESVIRGNTGPKILLVDIDGVIGVSKGVGSLFGGDEYDLTSQGAPSGFIPGAERDVIRSIFDDGLILEHRIA